MKKTIIAIVFLAVTVSVLVSALSGRQVNAKTQPKLAQKCVPGRGLVKFKSHIAADQARQVIAALGARDADEIPGIGVHILDLPSQASEVAFANAFKARADVAFAELDKVLSPEQMPPNDPLYADPNSWSLAKIDAGDAWSVNTGNNSVIIAILDTGVAATYPELASQIVPGWNIHNNNSDTRDVYGHGTEV